MITKKTNAENEDHANLWKVAWRFSKGGGNCSCSGTFVHSLRKYAHLFVLQILLKQNTALLSYVSVCVCVCHRRDISSFFDNLIV